MPKKSPFVPKHIVIVPDGNRRWARKRGLKPWEGHLKGSDKFIEDVIWTAFDKGVRYLTIWGGSYDNLTKRSKVEIRMLNKAYRQFVQRALGNKKIEQLGVRVRFVGEWHDVLEKDTIGQLEKVERLTKKNKKRNLTILVAYNGDREMLEGINKLVRKGRRVTGKTLKSSLWTAQIPPPDLVIRTGGEKRLSGGFLMWDIQYSELYFTKKLWPDFTKKDLLIAIKDYSNRERRFGK